MDIKRAFPRPELRSVVRSFEERRADLGSAVLTWPVGSRGLIRSSISIWLSHIRFASTVARQKPGRKQPWSDRNLSWGPRRICHCQIHVFNILFQPTGLNRLVGIKHDVAGQSGSRQPLMFSAKPLRFSATPCARHRTSNSVSPPSNAGSG